jgi:stage II sporulation protein D
MKYNRLLFSLFLLSLFSGGLSVDIRISLYHPHIIHSLIISCSAGSYSYATNDGLFEELTSGQQIFLKNFNHTLWIRKDDLNWTRLSSMYLTDNGDQSIISIKPVSPALPGRSYYGNLEIQPYHGSLQIINILDLERYLMGVVEAEAGPVAPLDFYKVQTIICRTYAIRNFTRHLEEGFNLCDNVHCQSYKGRNRWNEDVIISAEVTEGLILIDSDSMPIVAAFHSNSGGETQGAENIWLNGEAYLLPVLDPFSIDQPNARWERIIPADSWFNYLRSRNFKIDIPPDTLTFQCEQKHRMKHYIVGDDALEFNKIREDWNLKSTFFSVFYHDGNFVLLGKGYGHGVGLSQEGALNMARKGYHFTEILNYYYHNIRIVSYHLLPAGNIF